MSTLKRAGNVLTEQDKTDIRRDIGLGTAAQLDVPASGNAASGQVVKGGDTRLSDARTPTSHTHTASAITDFSSAADARIAAASINALADVAVTSPSTGQVLKWNGSAWVNDTDAGGAGATNLTYTASPTGGTVNSDTGTDASVPLSDGTNAGLMAPAQHTKLDGIAASATANATDAQLRDRATHTGTQSAATITGLATVATTGAYADLTGKPTLGTAAATDASAYATAAQGTDAREWSAATVDQAEAEAGAATTRRAWTAQRVRQAISAWWAASAGSLLKTINGNSLLGSGDLTIGGGGGATNLSYTASATGGTVSSDTGTDATLPLSDGTNAGLMAPAQHSKLAGIAAGATANSSDATLLNRANHTGTQAAATISDSTEAGRALLTAADAAAQRTALGLGTAATTAASAYATSAQGVPAGGATGQVLAKTSATDYAVAWTTASGGDSRSTTLTFTNSITPATLFQWQYAGYGIGSNANGETLIRIDSSNRVWMGNTGVRVRANVPDSGIAWTTSEDMLSSTVLAIVRDADNVAAQRNGTNAQERRTYGTYTDASNYRRLSHGMSTAGVAHIRPEGAGTGASGNVLHISGLPTSDPGPGILWNDAGTVKVGT